MTLLAASQILAVMFMPLETTYLQDDFCRQDFIRGAFFFILAIFGILWTSATYTLEN